jgi:hypothetical protein
MVRLPQCNWSFYSCKLHNFYCAITLLDAKLPTTMLSTFELLPTIFDVFKSKKLETILPTLSTTSTPCTAHFCPSTFHNENPTPYPARS